MGNKLTNFIAGLGLAANIASGQPLPDNNIENPSLDQILRGSPENPGFGYTTKTKVADVIDIKSPKTRVESLENGELNGFLDNNTSSSVKGFKTKSDVLFNVYGVSKEITGNTYNGVGLDIRGKQFEIKTEKGKKHTLIGGVGVLNINEDFYVKGGAGLLNLDQLSLGTEGYKYDIKSTNIGAAVGYRGTISDSTHTNLEVGRINNSVTGTFGKVTGNTDFIEAALETDFDSGMKARVAGSLEKNTAKTAYGDSFDATKSTLSAAFYPNKDLELELGYTGLDLHKGDYNTKAGMSIPFTEKGFKSPRLFVSANKNITTHNTASITYQAGIADIDMSLKHAFERNVLANNINPTMLKGANSQAKKYEEEQKLKNIDTTPTAFTFTDVTGQALNTVIESAAITVAGINSASAISVSGGEYQINGGTWVSGAGTVNSGDTVKVRHTTSASNSTVTNTTLTIGGINDIFSTTTLAPAVDTTPDAFTFTDVTGQALSTVIESAAITVAGINSASAISVSGGEYQINGGTWVSGAGTVNSGDTVKVRHTTSASNSTVTNTTLTIGGINDIFSTTTLADVIAPASPTGLSLNSGATYTNSTTVSLDGLTGPGDASHWFVSESSSAPLAGNAGWVSSKPTSYTMGAGDTTRTIYVYVKDAAGNVQSVGVSDTIILDTVAASRAGENISPMTWGATISGNTITFSEDITSFTNIKIKDSGDNSVQGSVSDASISGVTGTMTITWPAAPSPSGFVYIEGTATDLAGNTSTVRTSGDYN